MNCQALMRWISKVLVEWTTRFIKGSWQIMIQIPKRSLTLRKNANIAKPSRCCMATFGFGYLLFLNIRCSYKIKSYILIYVQTPTYLVPCIVHAIIVIKIHLQFRVYKKENKSCLSFRRNGYLQLTQH